MKDFNIIKWVVGQPKEILLGIFIFAASYLTFLNYPGQSIPLDKQLLWFLLFLAGSILLAFFLSFLCRESFKKAKSIINERLLDKSDAVNIIKKIEMEGNNLKNSSLYQAGLAGSINIEVMAQELEIDESRVRNYIQEFIRFGWIEVDYEGEIYGISDHGRQIMHRKRLV